LTLTWLPLLRPLRAGWLLAPAAEASRSRLAELERCCGCLSSGAVRLRSHANPPLAGSDDEADDEEDDDDDDDDEVAGEDDGDDDDVKGGGGEGERESRDEARA
jgi:hypothetical protein